MHAAKKKTTLKTLTGAVYDLVEKDVAGGGLTKGSMFWNLYGEGDGDADPYHVTLKHSSTMAIIDRHVRRRAHARY